MEDILVSYETGKLARSKGFEVPCSAFHNVDKTTISDDKSEDKPIINAPYNWNFPKYDGNFVSIPTQSLLQKWLREIHSIDFDLCTTFSKQYSFIIYVGTNPVPDIVGDDYQTYEEALEVALQEGLKLIIWKV